MYPMVHQRFFSENFVRAVDTTIIKQYEFVSFANLYQMLLPSSITDDKMKKKTEEQQ